MPAGRVCYDPPIPGRDSRSATPWPPAAPRRRAARRGNRQPERQRTCAWRSLDDLVRPSKEGWRDRQAQRLGRFEVDHKFELGGLLDGEITGLGPLKDLVYVGGGAPMGVGEARAERDEPPGVNELAVWRNGGQAVLQSIVGDRPAPLKRGRGHEPEPVHPSTRESVECAVEVSDRANLSADEVETELGPCALDDRLVPLEGFLKAGGPEDADARYRGCQPLEQFKLLGRLLWGGLEGNARHVASGPSQACHESSAHGIWNTCKHDRYGVGGLLGGQSGRSGGSINHVHSGRDKLPGQLGQALDLAFGRPILEEYRLPIDVSQLAQPGTEVIDGGGNGGECG